MHFSSHLKLTALLIVAAGLASRLGADVTLAPLFQDHAVLQRDQPVPVWGRAAPGEVVTVAFREHRVSATTDKNGRWSVRLPALSADATPAELVVSGLNVVRVADVLVGEVWLCSGQSNMEFPVDPERAPPDRLGLDRQDEETAAANFPLIRFFKADHAPALVPSDRVGGVWKICAPAAMRTFTAAGYFFARDLHRKLGVPIGIVDGSWGGTPIESWLGAGALAANPAFQIVAKRWTDSLGELPARKKEFEHSLATWKKKEAEAHAKGLDALAAFRMANPVPRAPRISPVSAWTPSALYNGMIAPLAPYAIRGMLWYQGESNASRADEYRALFGAMITQWRREWGAADLPFYFVQLASYVAPNQQADKWAFLREAQAQTLALPATGMAVIIDNPDPANLHPGNKQVVGHRLALIALAQTYGEKSEWSGPVLASAKREGAAFRLSFTHAAGLMGKSAAPEGFAIAGADRIFHNAEARIDGETIVVSAAAVPEPVALRYGWANAPVASLFNGAGLPASPFRTDDW